MIGASFGQILPSGRKTEMANEKEFNDKLNQLGEMARQVGKLQMRNELLKAIETNAFSEALTLFREMPAGDGSNLAFMSMLSEMISKAASNE